jgi:hypothetical protein
LAKVGAAGSWVALVEETDADSEESPEATASFATVLSFFAVGPVAVVSDSFSCAFLLMMLSRDRNETTSPSALHKILPKLEGLDLE